MTPQVAISKPEQFQALRTPPREEKPTLPLEEQLIKLIDRYWALGRFSRQRRHYIWSQVELFSKGIHFFSYNHQKGSYQEWDQKDQDIYTPVPLVQYAVENIAAEFSKSKPKIMPHADSDDRKIKAALSELEHVADSLFSRFYLENPEERQREAKLAPLRDSVFIFLDYDHTAGADIETPIYEPKESSVCVDCGTEVPDNGQGSIPQVSMGLSDNANMQVAGNLEGVQPQLDGLLACPQCGSSNIHTVTGIAQTGTQKGKQGEVKRYVVDGFQIDTVDRRFSVRETNYLRYDDILFVDEAKQSYPHVEIKGKAYLGRSDVGFSGLHTLRQLEILISNTGNLDQSKPDNVASFSGAYLEDSKCVRSRIWFLPSAYRSIAAPANTQLPGTDDVLPSGARMAELYPDGAMITLINDKIVKIDRQVLTDRWVAYKYSIPTSGMFGCGMAPIVSLNKAYDELTSIETQGALSSSLGITLIDERVKGYVNKPGTYTYVSDRLPDEKLTDMVAHMTTGNPGPQVGMLRQSYKENIADLSLARNPNTQGMTAQGMKTATGVRYQDETANALSSPKLELFAAACAEVIEKTVKLEKTYNVRPRYYSKFGDTVGKWIDPLDIPEEIRFIPEEDSHQPRTQENRKSDTGNAISLGWGTPNLLPIAQEQIAKEFRMPKGEDDYDAWSIKAEKRLDAMREVARVMGQQEEAMAQSGMQQPPDSEGSEIVPDDEMAQPAMSLIQFAKAAPQPLDNHILFQRFWTEVYLSDDFDEMPPVLQDAIVQLHGLHEVAMAQKQGQQAMLQQSALAPVMEQEQAMQQGQQESQNVADAESQDRQQVAQQESDEAARQHEREMTQEKFKHEDKQTKMKTDAQKAVASKRQKK